MKIAVKIIAGLLITAILVVVGYFGYLFYKNDFDFKKMFGIGTSEKLIEEKDIELLKNLEIKFNTGTVDIVPSEDGKIKVMLYSDRECEHSINTEELGTAKIEINEKKLSFFKRIFNHKQARILVYIPSDYEGNIDIDGDVGDINIDNYKYSILNTKLNVGDIYIDGIKEATVDLDAGNLKIKQLFSDMDLKVNAGNIKMKEVTLLKNSNIHVNVGNVTIEETNEIKIEADAKVGTKDIKKSDDKAEISLNIIVDVGNITVLAPSEEKKGN